MAWLLFLLAPLLTGCASDPPLQRFEFTRLCMGVQSRIVTWAHDRNTATDAAAAAFSEIGRLDGTMSDYQKDSELNRLSDTAGGGTPVPLGDDLFRIIALSKRVSRDSGHAFDITVGPAVALWREARRTGRIPSAEDLARARTLIGDDQIILDDSDHSALLTRPGARLDLGAIAKGYAAQSAVDLLARRGLPRSLVAMSGDIAVGDPPPGQPGWRVALEGEQSGKRIGVLLVANTGVSTSGDTEQFVEIAGRRFSHMINPATAEASTERRTASITGLPAEQADALATAACILGPERTRELLERYRTARHHPAAIFEEVTDAGTRRTLIDPDHVLRWADSDQETARARANTAR